MYYSYHTSCRVLLDPVCIQRSSSSLLRYKHSWIFLRNIVLVLVLHHVYQIHHTASQLRILPINQDRDSGNVESLTNREIEHIFPVSPVRCVVGLYFKRELLHKRTAKDSLGVWVGIPGPFLYSESRGR